MRLKLLFKITSSILSFPRSSVGMNPAPLQRCKATLERHWRRSHAERGNDKKRGVLIAQIISISTVLTACNAVGINYKTPSIATPKQWSEPLNNTAKKDNVELDKWWLSFNDSLLNELIQEAINANLDLKVALLRVKDARILRSQTIATALPSLNAKTTLSKRLNNSSQTSGNNSSGSTGGGGFGVGNQIINIFQLGFDAQWELDFFGGTKRAIEAADATVDSELENSRAVLVTLLSEVARNLLEYRTQKSLIALTQENLATLQQSLELLQAQQKVGLINDLAIVQTQAQMANTKAQLPLYENTAWQAAHALSVLLGKEPNALNYRLANAAPLPNTQNLFIINELPSDLLKRRPDIRKAERQVAIATAGIGIATADLYPRLNLAAFAGFQNMHVTDFTPVGKSWSSSASFTMPLFNWGKLNAVVKSKRVQNEQALLNYQASILTAFQEVEDALAAYRTEKQRNESLNQAYEAVQLSQQLASERYNKGLSDYMAVLTAEDSLQNAQTELINSEHKQHNALIALYKALGGGWQNEMSINKEANSNKNSLAVRLFKP